MVVGDSIIPINQVGSFSTQRLEILLRRIKHELVDIYDISLEYLILYGSFARGEATILSDIDLLGVIQSDINPYQEIDKTAQLIADYSLENDIVISCQFISSKKFHQQDTPFLMNVKREGIVI